MLKFEIIEEYGEKKVVFENGWKARVYKNKEHGEYFRVPRFEAEDLFSRGFTDRIKDLYDYVVQGKGDCLQVIELFGRSENLVYFLDREVGERNREKFLKEFNCDFGYALKYSRTNSMNSSYISENMETVLLGTDFAKFKTREQAEEFKESIYKSAKELYDKYIACQESEEEISKLLKEHVFKVYYSICADMVDNEKNVDIEIVQCIM